MHQPYNIEPGLHANHKSEHSYEVEGFAAVAEWMARDRDGESLIYRKFADLTARNLLYLQCELLCIGKKMAELDQKAAADNAGMDVKDVARRWEALVERSAAGDGNATDQMCLVLKLREKIKEYHEALILSSRVTELHKPSGREIEACQTWLNGGRKGGAMIFPALGGAAKDYLDEPADLIGLKSKADMDFLSKTLRRWWPSVEKETARDGLLQIARFDERSISRAVGAISVLVAAIVLLGPLTALYFTQSEILKLVMIYIFTAVFALSVACMTNARRSELFAATAAYVAVLVVFVGNGIGGAVDASTAPG